MSLTAEHVDIRSTLTGDFKAVAERLKVEKDKQVVAFTVDKVSRETLDAFTKTLETAAHLLADMMLKRQQDTIEQIVSMLVPKAPIRPAAFKEAQMLAAAKRAVLESGDWLSAADIAQLADFATANPSSQPNKWKREGKIFAIRHNGNDYYPNFALDKSAGYRPRAGMRDVLKVFGEAKDGWGLAYWFASVNSFLGGKRPQDVLVTDPARVVAAAEDEMAGVTHG